MEEQWLRRLRQAYEAGYYRTEADEAEQSFFPWQGKRCRDCPFLMGSRCQVRQLTRTGNEVPCLYFDPPNHEAARQAVTERLEMTWRKRWKWQY